MEYRYVNIDTIRFEYVLEELDIKQTNDSFRKQLKQIKKLLTVREEDKSQQYYHVKTIKSSSYLLFITVQGLNFIIFSYIPTAKMKSMLLLVYVLVLTQPINWQGTGNMSNANLTVIWNFINNNLGTDYDIFNTQLSNYLNTQWSPAWNVFTILTDAATDTVVYGYAFNNHWLWYNNYIDLGGNHLDLIIWKDYNCDTWQTLGINGQTSTLTTQQASQLMSAAASVTTGGSVNDVWASAKMLVDLAQQQSLFSGNSHAFTAVLSQNSNSIFHGRACILKNNFYSFRQYGPLFDPQSTQPSGKFWLLQTR